MKDNSSIGPAFVVQPGRYLTSIWVSRKEYWNLRLLPTNRQDSIQILNKPLPLAFHICSISVQYLRSACPNSAGLLCYLLSLARSLSPHHPFLPLSIFSVLFLFKVFPKEYKLAWFVGLLYLCPRELRVFLIVWLLSFTSPFYSTFNQNYLISIPCPYCPTLLLTFLSPIFCLSTQYQSFILHYFFPSTHTHSK